MAGANRNQPEDSQQEQSTQDRVVSLLNEAQHAKDGPSKVEKIRQVHELIIHRDPTLLDNFLDEMLAFMNHPVVDIKKLVVNFIEEACKKDREILPKIIPNLLYMLSSDQNANVQKRVINACSHLYPMCLKWVAESRKISVQMESCWEEFAQLKGRILVQLDSDNEGLLSFRKLESEGRALVDKLLDLMARPHISSVNLMTCMGCLTNIARQGSSINYVTQFEKYLGATHAQVMKALPAHSELRKRMRKGDDDHSATAKKRHKEVVEDEEEKDEEEDELKQRKNNAIDITADYLCTKLTPSNVADLVLLTMVVLPDTMPPQFQSSYTPIAAAGTQAQIRHLARLMATQLTAADVGPGVEQVKWEAAEKRAKMVDQQRTADVPPTPKLTIETMVGMSSAVSTAVPAAMGPPGAPPPKQGAAGGAAGGKQQPLYGAPGTKMSKRMQQFGLVHITRPLDPDQQFRMAKSAFERIMNAEKRAVQGGAASGSQNLLVRIASRFNSTSLQECLEEFILADQKSRGDLAVLWLYEEYAGFQGFTVVVSADKQEEMFDRYDRCLCRMLNKLFSKGEHKESLFHKLLLEAPFITPNALDILKQACMDKVYGQFGLCTLREMIVARPKQRVEFVSALLDFTCFERHEFRSQCLKICKELYKIPWIQADIKAFVSVFLHHLLEPSPPPVLFGEDRGRPSENQEKWEEDTIKACLYLYLHLLPVDHSLIHDLAKVYVETTSDTKRVLLRHLEIPLKAMGMHSQELLNLVENCPKGAETLVTRIVHLLTERSPPTPVLVAKVCALYMERVPDVRCLIPVLTGLKKQEILGALPKLIRLNPNVVKEVFNRLLFGKSLETGHAPMTPTELLVTLHSLEAQNHEQLKYIITAMNLLLGMRQVYTKEVMAGVIQQLLDLKNLPDLMMRTVIQAVTFYPTLVGFIMNVLHRLIIGKQIWKQPRAWEGFIRCCQRTTPQSFQILLTLPAEQLEQVFMMSPEMRDPLLQHVGSLSAHQQSSISPGVVAVLQMDPSQYGKDAVKGAGGDSPRSQLDASTSQSDTEAETTRNHPEIT